MELVHWFIVAISVLPDGSVSLGHGPVLDSFATRSACEAALWNQFDYGFSAGYEARETEEGLKLVLEREDGQNVWQCLSPWSRHADN
jgi:hypothetical protein